MQRPANAIPELFKDEQQWAYDEWLQMLKLAWRPLTPKGFEYFKDQLHQVWLERQPDRSGEDLTPVEFLRAWQETMSARATAPELGLFIGDARSASAHLIREWANANGFTVGDRRRIPTNVYAAYKNYERT